VSNEFKQITNQKRALSKPRSSKKGVAKRAWEMRRGDIRQPAGTPKPSEKINVRATASLGSYNRRGIRSRDRRRRVPRTKGDNICCRSEGGMPVALPLKMSKPCHLKHL